MSDIRRPARPEYIGRYRVLDRIGKGAMGVVYSAHDDVMGRDVAIKVMMTGFEGEPDDIRARFQREAQISARLAHRNIVTVFDIGEDNGRLFIVMELLRGETLAECLKQRTLTLEQKVDLTVEVCEGLAVANAAGICHRDVKPGNLFLQTDGSVKILDFGIARLASSSMTASGFILGTPDYMSPEQARGTAIDERSDIFSVGAVLYLLLAGRKPFVAPDLPAVLHKVVSEEPPPIPPGDAPPVLSRIVFRALAKDPAARFQSFRELSADLSRWRRHYEVETRTLAAEAVRAIEALHGLAAEERQAAEALGVPPEAHVDAWLAEVGAGYPDLLSSGADALKAGQMQRAAVDEITRRANALAAAWQPRVAELRRAVDHLTAATGQLDAGDAPASLVSLDLVLRDVPNAAIAPLVERARAIVADEQARHDRVRSLLGEAADTRRQGRLDSALALGREALAVDGANAAAGQLVAELQRDIAAAAAENARRCARLLDRARRALQMEQIEEAARQLQLATETGVAHADLAIVATALSEARSARDAADAVIQEIASELTRARAEFHDGNAAAAIGRLEALAVRHPASLAAQSELARLRAEEERLAESARILAEAERLTTEAAAALQGGDAQAAATLAEEALTRVPSHEPALRTSALAHAQLREIGERAAREERARQFVEEAAELLAAGRYEAAIKEARRAAELDPSGTAAPALLGDAFRRLAEVSRAERAEKEAARRAAEVREVLESAAAALRSRDFARARALAERAIAIDPDHSAPRDLIARIATAAAVAATELDDQTVTIAVDAPDEDRTAAITPAGAVWAPQRRIPSMLLWWRRGWLSAIEWLQRRWPGRGRHTVDATPQPGTDPHQKEP